MNSFMTSLIKNVKPDFIVSPQDLLETKETIILDSRAYSSAYEEIARSIFQEPQHGAYLLWTTKPLFTAYEKLYTHKDTHEYFPEITSRVVRPFSEVFHAQLRGKNITNTHVRETVGDRINWRDAVENQINVYNESGRLLLNKSQNRSNLRLVFNPGPEINSLNFLLDLVEVVVLEATNWGDPNPVKEKIRSYLLHGIDLDAAIKTGTEMNWGFFQQIITWVKKDPWLVYKVNSFGSNIIIESSCDYRHFKCNELLLEKIQATEQDSDILNSFSIKDRHFGTIHYDDLDDLYADLFDSTGHRVTSVPELFDFLDNTKANVGLTNTIVSVFDVYLTRNAARPSQAAEFISKVVSKNFVGNALGKQNGLSSTDFNSGTGIYIL